MRRRRWATAQPECRRCCQPASRRMRRASRWTTKQSSADLLLHTLMRRPSGSSNGCRESREQRGGRSDRRCLLGFDARLETGGLQTCRHGDGQDMETQKVFSHQPSAHQRRRRVTRLARMRRSQREAEKGASQRAHTGTGSPVSWSS